MDRSSGAEAAARAVKSTSTTRMLAFFARMGRAASWTLGAITASMNVDVIACAVSASIGRFNPTMPPKAASASACRART